MWRRSCWRLRPCRARTLCPRRGFAQCGMTSRRSSSPPCKGWARPCVPARVQMRVRGADFPSCGAAAGRRSSRFVLALVARSAAASRTASPRRASSDFARCSSAVATPDSSLPSPGTPRGVRARLSARGHRLQMLVQIGGARAQMLVQIGVGTELKQALWRRGAEASFTLLMRC